MSITAAKLQAEVGADTKGFDRGMAHADGVIAKAPGKWSTALKVGAGAALTIGGALVVRGVTDAIGSGLAAIREDEAVAAQTAAVVKSTGGAARVTATDIDTLATAIQNKTAIEDKDVAAGANMLLTFTNIRNEAGAGNDVFTQSVGVLADLSTAMGTDMKSSAIQLGKALNDPLKGITALQRVGVTFDAQQKKRIAQFVAEGKVAEAQKVILAELNKEFGGSGAAFAATDTGEAAKFGYVIEDLQKTLAHGLMPAIKNVRQALTEFLADPSTLGMAEDLGNAIGGIFSKGNLTTAATLMKTTAGIVSQAFTAFGKLPPEIQALAVGALALKKITGIGVTDIAKGATGLFTFIFDRGASPANPLWVAPVGGALGGGGAVGGAVTSGSSLLQKVAVVGSVAIAAGSLAALAQQIGTFVNDVGKDQATLRGQVDATLNQNYKDSKANLDATISHLNSLPVWERIIDATAGGTEITKDIVAAADRMAAKAVSKADLEAAKSSIAAAVITARDNNLTSAVAPLKADLAAINRRLITGAYGNAPAPVYSKVPANTTAGFEHNTMRGGPVATDTAAAAKDTVKSSAAVASAVTRGDQQVRASVQAGTLYVARSVSTLGGRVNALKATDQAGFGSVTRAVNAGTAVLKANKFTATVTNKLTITPARVSVVLNAREIAAAMITFTSSATGGHPGAQPA